MTADTPSFRSPAVIDRRYSPPKPFRCPKTPRLSSKLLRMSKRARRAAAVIVAFVLLLVVGALVFLQSAVFHQWVLQRIQKAATDAGYAFTAERLDLDLWNLQATLTRAAYDDGNGTRVSFERAFLQIPWDAFRSDVIQI